MRRSDKPHWKAARLRGSLIVPVEFCIRKADLSQPPAFLATVGGGRKNGITMDSLERRLTGLLQTVTSPISPTGE